MTGNELRLLLVEDDEDDYIITRDLLSEVRENHFSLTWEKSYERGLHALMTGAFDMCLLDFRLGQHTGLDFLGAASASGISTPVILLTGEGAGDIDIKALKAGAADYLVKSTLSAPLLERAIRYARERADVAEQLRQSEGYRVLADTMPQLAWSSRPDGVHDYFNRRWHEYSGLSADQAQGVGWAQLLHDDDRSSSVIFWKAALQAGHAYETEARFRRNDGAYRWFIVRALPARGADGQILRWFGTATDIEEQKRGEAERDRDRETMVGMLSHDLRNPLAAIVMGAETALQRAKLDSADAKIVGRVATSAQRMARMIDQLLDYTRSRLGGGLPIERKPIDLQQLTHTVIEEHEMAHPERLVSFRTAGDGWGQWDPDRMAQVVANLLGNARHHGGEGKPVDVLVDGTGEKVVLEIRNHGHPIPAELVGHIFEPFRRGQQRKRPGQGLGLGLYITKQIIDAHGGTIDVTCSEDTVTFSVALPRP